MRGVGVKKESLTGENGVRRGGKTSSTQEGMSNYKAAKGKKLGLGSTRSTEPKVEGRQKSAHSTTPPEIRIDQA